MCKNRIYCKECKAKLLDKNTHENDVDENDEFENYNYKKLKIDHNLKPNEPVNVEIQNVSDKSQLYTNVRNI